MKAESSERMGCLFMRVNGSRAGLAHLSRADITSNSEGCGVMLGAALNGSEHRCAKHELSS